MIKNDLEEEIIKTQELLNKEENNGWKETYKNYAELMKNNIEKDTNLGKNFREWEPFKYYLTVGNAKNENKKLKISVRYLGQEVATMSISEDETTITITEKKSKTNERDFGYDKVLKNVKWSEAKEFREFFRKRKPIRSDEGKGNEEHRLESLLLTEFSKNKSIDKLLCGIQPITFAGFRLPMPTAVSSSGKTKMGTGHIDIFARTLGRKMAVLELKDENNPKEPIEKVLKQATAYAVFILELLHSESGKDWYKIFGFNGELNTEKPITIRVCSVMPHKKNAPDDTFESFKLKCGQDYLEYHWMYFGEKDNKIIDIESSLKDESNNT